VAEHVFHIVPGPVGALTVATLLIGPLIERLQGGPPLHRSLGALWSGPHRPPDDRDWAVPVRLSSDGGGRSWASPIEYRGKDDLLGFAKADALAILPARSGPWSGGEIVEVMWLC
jgi:molybdopterin biosynthesis enzyme